MKFALNEKHPIEQVLYQIEDILTENNLTLEVYDNGISIISHGSPSEKAQRYRLEYTGEGIPSTSLPRELEHEKLVYNN